MCMYNVVLRMVLKEMGQSQFGHLKNKERHIV